MSTPVAAVLLAGGRSTRMGQDKALLRWQGRPVWQAQLDKLRELRPARLLLSCRREQALLPPAGTEVLHDPEHSDDGPLGAITRCLEQVQMPLLVLAVDMPWMSLDFLRAEMLPGRFFRGPHGFEALAAVYTPAMLPVMREALAARRLALQAVIKTCVKAGIVTPADIPERRQDCFRNANTQEDWRPACA